MKRKISAASPGTSSKTKPLRKLENTLGDVVNDALARLPRLVKLAKHAGAPGPIDYNAPDSPSSANARLTPSHEEIAIRAEALWKEMGCPQGCDKQIWLAAERRLIRDMRLEKEEKDRKALLEQLSLINHLRMEDVMGRLEELYPEPTGESTTSL